MKHDRVTLLNSKFGKLLVIKFHSKQNRVFTWDCQCECGNIVVRNTGELNRGKNKNRQQSCRPCAQRLNKTKKSGVSSWRLHYNSYVSGARRRELAFPLSIDDFISICSENCYYCGALPKPFNRYVKLSGASIGEVSANSQQNSWIYVNGIDRLDSDKGYEKGNIVSCCSPCNYIKLDLHEDEFLSIVKKIYEFKGLNNK